MTFLPPMLAIVHVLPRRMHRGIRLWVPLFLVWLLLAPFVLVLLPVYFVVCAVVDIAPFRTLGTIFAVLGSLNGTHVEVDSPAASVFIHVY
ncbi:MAG TPA: hypothetical protein VNU97_18995 [Rhizomicrobium sp.]|jgi:hypothetical protein|nr:hypothetical protein [Rhizomicrobium sp.]